MKAAQTDDEHLAAVIRATQIEARRRRELRRVHESRFRRLAAAFGAQPTSARSLGR